MNIQGINKTLQNNLPRYILTLSSSSPYYAEISDENIVIKTNRKIIHASLESLYTLIVDVISEKSFEIKRYKFNHKNVSYLLPIVKIILTKSDFYINEFTPPKGGWRKELSQEEIIEKIYLHDELNHSFKNTPSNDNTAYRINNNLIGSIEDTEEQVLVDVHYATNRKPVGGSRVFSHEKDDMMNYGVAKVSIPKNVHRSGKIERPLEIFSFSFREDKNKHFTIESGVKLNEIDFFEKLKIDSDRKRLIIFIHGYNVNFKDAVFKSAQIKYDLNFEWPILLFSWPSRSKIKAYVADKEMALYSADDLKRLLEKVSAIDIDDVMVIGHSMGSFCLAEALKTFTSNNNSFKRLALAAADIQKNEFTQTYAAKMQSIFKMISLYISSSDKALIASNLINQFERIGDARNGITIVNGIESIDISDADSNLFSLGHSYISESNKALDDLYHFLVNGLPARKRRLKELVNNQSMTYWTLH